MPSECSSALPTSRSTPGVLMRKVWLGLAALPLLACLTSGPAWGQASRPLPANAASDTLDWKEEAVPPAPPFSKDRVIALSMPPYVSVRVGIDPDTVQVGSDGVVRYVAVMTNASGTLSATYEGIRCTTGEVKTYARFGSSGQWMAVTEPVWKPLLGSVPSPHAYVFAHDAACNSHVAEWREDILRQLRQPAQGKPARPAL